jgi:uncharacterized protein YbcV (DUF1398 family)
MLSISSVAVVDEALARAAAVRPAVGGFPYLAESLRQGGVVRVSCVLPAVQTTYVLASGAAVHQAPPLLETGERLHAVAPFDEARLIAAIRADQAGETTYWPEFVTAAWAAGVVAYDVDLAARTCCYRGAHGDTYVERYAAVTLPDRP